MSDELRKLELKDVLQSDAAEIAAARAKAVLIHRSGDIDAAGEEVEEAVREVLRRKLPVAYYIGHGHVIDANWNNSPQVDVVIADNAGAPILFRTKSGTEYFPYESVYAVGEVKSAYYKEKQYIHSFVSALARIQRGMSREQTSPRYLASGIELGKEFMVRGVLPYRNPLFSFMIFVHGNNFEVEDILELYTSTPASQLPNVLCFLDKGVVKNVRLPAVPAPKLSGPLNWNLYPEFNKQQEGWVNRWAFMPMGASDSMLGGNFGFLYFALCTHLKSCVLRPPDMLAYLRPVFFPGGITEMKVFG